MGKLRHCCIFTGVISMYIVFMNRELKSTWKTMHFLGFRVEVLDM